MLNIYKILNVSLNKSSRRVVLYLCITIVLTLASVSIPMITKNLVNNGIVNGSEATIVWSAVFLASIGILNQFLILFSKSLEISRFHILFLCVFRNNFV